MPVSRFWRIKAVRQRRGYALQTILCGQRGRSDAHHWVGRAALSRHGVDY